MPGSPNDRDGENVDETRSLDWKKLEAVVVRKICWTCDESTPYVPCLLLSLYPVNFNRFYFQIT